MKPFSREISVPCQIAALPLLLLLAVVLPAQTADLPNMAKDASPQFEVATIKPSDPADQNYGFHTSGHRIFVENQTVSSILSVAYAIHRSQIVDAPAWFDHDRFDVHGVPDQPGVPNLKQLQEMLQKLLADRFQLKFHRDRRELSVYAITVGKSGPRLAKSAGDPNGLPDEIGFGRGSQRILKFTNSSISDLALNLQDTLEKPVIDTTSLPGRFDFTLTWTPDTVVPSEPNPAPGLFTAFQEQLGLKLQPTRLPTDVLVIDHAEKPSEN